MKLLRIMGTALLFLATQSSHLMGMDKKTIEHNLMILHAHSKKDALKRTAGDVAKTEEALRTLKPAADAGSLSAAQKRIYDRVLGQIEDDKKRLGMTTVTMRTDGTLPEEMSPRRAALLAKRGITVTGQPKVTTPVVKPGMTKPEVNAQVNVTGMSPRRAALLAKRGISITGTPLTVPAVVIPGTQVTRGTQVANNEMVEALIKDKIENKLTQFFVGNQVKSAEAIKVFGDLRQLQRQGSSYTNNVIISLIGKAIDANKNPFIKEDMKRNLEEEFRRMFFEAPALPPRVPPALPSITSGQQIANEMIESLIVDRIQNKAQQFFAGTQLKSAEVARIFGDLRQLQAQSSYADNTIISLIGKSIDANKNPFIKENMKRNLEEEFRKLFFETPALPPRMAPALPPRAEEGEDFGVSGEEMQGLFPATIPLNDSDKDIQFTIERAFGPSSMMVLNKTTLKSIAKRVLSKKQTARAFATNDNIIELVSDTLQTNEKYSDLDRDDILDKFKLELFLEE